MLIQTKLLKELLLKSLQESEDCNEDIENPATTVDTVIPAEKEDEKVELPDDVVISLTESTAKAEVLSELIDELRIQRQDLKDTIIELKSKITDLETQLKEKEEKAKEANESIIFDAQRYDGALKKSLSIINSLKEKLQNKEIKCDESIENTNTIFPHIDSETNKDSKVLLFNHE